ncbi:3'(2'),5'-bisphosphate nucleotidase SAL1 [Chondrus crispus]|uniref:3'(2'),5'-bisphosphate nucleotidase n=1 Tax=Chondrus crispus TaxID=2769 RepID=R7QQQ1_CHOCR|nr:3'(2'),5'-bisphosphate nucleotidase SAL1 [Chondrus crispus]CDF40827.1 3'(2'),5'-bisphosphate nucleotidase SAL1 [Chondrus crispus]|eukprot:XP_005711121.1 3'(2'),5'-bisphosphate nucleotidase SAL1 [Chondrus crispus]
MVSPSASKYSAERAAAVTSVALASALARRLQHALSGSKAVAKADASPVTVADFAVQAVIVSHLHSRFPNDRFIAEESTPALRKDPALLRAVCDAADMDESHLLKIIDLCDHEGGDGARTWILDPIDGTKGFIAMRQYCIALGLIDGGVARVGVLGCPNLPLTGMEAPDTGSDIGCIFHAEQGEGTWMLAEGDVDTSTKSTTATVGGKRCVVSKVAEPSWTEFCESVERGHSSHELSARVAEILKVTAPPVRMDSQAKYGCMARGDVSIFLRFPRDGYVENVWDSAPAAIIVEEAGGRVTDGRGRPLNFNLGRKLDNDDGIVATNGYMHDAIIAAVQMAVKEQVHV